MQLHNPPSPRLRVLLAAAAGLWLWLAGPAQAQWTTESYPLKAGWNAVWIPLDVSHATLEELAHGDIEELWRWNALEAARFVDTPSGPPSQTDLQWSVWRRGNPEGSTLSVLTGNMAYLVKVRSGASPFTWSLKGRPLPPHFEWSTTGLNLVGFATPAPGEGSAPSFERFFGFDAELSTLASASRILYYNGGELSDTAPRNPVSLSGFSAPVERHRAYWVKAEGYVNYYGPLQVEVRSTSGLTYGEDLQSIAVRLTNVINPQLNQTVTARLSLQPSQEPPAGQEPIAGPVPLKVRGALNLTSGSHAYEDFTGPITRALPPGASTEVTLTVDRSAMGAQPRALHQSLLKISDSLGQTSMLLPVSARTTPRTGLWGGAAALAEVERLVGTTATPGRVPRAFPLRLLLHVTEGGRIHLLQQAYLGEHDGQPAVAPREADFTPGGRAASRVSSAQFPAGMVAAGQGALGLGGELRFRVELPVTEPTHPFLHSYHPDHDNLDERFEQALPAGREVPHIIRDITLKFAPASPLGFDPAWGGTTLGGTYTETISGLRARPITCSGTFHLHRASDAGIYLGR